MGGDTGAVPAPGPVQDAGSEPTGLLSVVHLEAPAFPGIWGM